jgi:hypothetical protein
MSATVEHRRAAEPVFDQVDHQGEKRRPRRRRVIAAGVLVVVGAAIAVMVADPFAGSGASPGGLADNADPTSVTTISQGDISSQISVSGTLGYSGSYTVVNQAQGTIVQLPAIGQIVSEGQMLYDVSGDPVVLLYGMTPAFRTLSEGATDAATSGVDVENLNYDLVALGYLTSADIAAEPFDFTAYTKAGVEALQAALGVPQTGVLSLGQVVFLPSAARITAVGQNTVLGGQAQPGSPILTASSTTRVVTIDLDADQQGDVKVGDKVTITLPNGQNTTGTVTSVGTVASSSSGDNGNSSPTITVLVTPDNPTATGSLDLAPVQVSITASSAKNAFIVPVDSLVPLATGGYALEVIGARGVHRLEPVTLGLFDDANEQVQVNGPGVAAGQRIVIPAS